MVAMGIKTTVVILHRPSRRDWKTWSPYPIIGVNGNLHLTLWQRLECPDGRPQQDSLHNLATAPH